MLKISDACAANQCLGTEPTCHGPPNNVPSDKKCLDWCCPLDWMKIGITSGAGVLLLIIIAIICCCCCRKKPAAARHKTVLQEAINY